MAKLGKLNNKLKSAIKRWPSFTKLSRPSYSPAVTVANSHDDYDDNNHDHHDKVISKEVYEVCVGKSRRRYLLASHVVRHPLFQELIDRSSSGGRSGGSGCDGDDDHVQVVVVACEVVLFEHLLWMLESDAAGGSYDDSQFHAGLGSMHELVDFYFTS